MNKIMTVILYIYILIFQTDSAWAESGWLDWAHWLIIGTAMKNIKN